MKNKDEGKIYRVTCSRCRQEWDISYEPSNRNFYVCKECNAEMNCSNPQAKYVMRMGDSLRRRLNEEYDGNMCNVSEHKNRPNANGPFFPFN